MEKLHPFTVKGALRFKTPPLREALAEFERRVLTGQAAITVHGMPDTGKSTMMTFLLERMSGSKKAVVYHMVMASSSIDEKQLMRELLTSNGTKESFPSVTPKEALVRSALAKCDGLGVPRVVFLIDEAQMLTKAHFELMRGLLADLTAMGLAPFAGLFAQPEILRKRWQLKDKGDASLINRFLGRPYRFRGLRRDEFEEVLKLLDEARWPEEGPTYTEYFAPTFWARGDKLANWAEVFAKEFGELSLTWGRDPDDLPTSYLNEAVHTFYAGVADTTRTPAEMNQLVARAVNNSPAPAAFEFLAGLEESVQQIPPPELPGTKARRSRVA
jgi:type II secretory pathway predicted ATPase ExeA